MGAESWPHSSTKLYYLNIEGLGEPIRLALQIAGIEFEDIRVDGAKWPELKSEMPMGQMPVLEVDGVRFAQYEALLRYIGRFTGLYPVDDPVRALKVDEMLGLVGDLQKASSPSMYEADPERKMALRKKLSEETLPMWFEFAAKRIADHGANGFCVGPTLTIADLALARFLRWVNSGILDGVDPTLHLKHPALVDVCKAVSSIDAVKAWREKCGKAVEP